MQNKKTVLIIEDEKSLREAIVDVLGKKDIKTLEARNGKEGVEKALEAHPDLILLDLVMPEMDGMTAFKKIREDKWGADAKIIILTNLSANTEKLVEDMVTNKPLYYLIKSDCKIHDVADKVKEALAD